MNKLNVYESDLRHYNGSVCIHLSPFTLFYLCQKKEHAGGCITANDFKYSNKDLVMIPIT